MKHSIAVACLIVFVTGETAHAAPPQFDFDSWTGAVHDVVVGTQSTANDALITDVQSAGQCRSKFVTAGGSVAVDWATVSNVIPTVEGNGETLSLIGLQPVIKLHTTTRTTARKLLGAFVAVRNCRAT